MPGEEELLELTLFGTFQLKWRGTPVAGLSSPKIQALLAYLAAARGEPFTREHLATLLWPEHEPQRGRQNLRQSLVRLSRALAKAAAPVLLQVDRRQIELPESAPIQVDFLKFSEALAKSEVHEHRDLHRCQVCAETLADAVSWQRGPFLAGLFADSAQFDEWALVRREWARREQLVALGTLVVFHLNQANYQKAYDHAWQQVTLEPLDEAAQQMVLRTLGLQGRVQEARTQLQGYQELLAREMDLEPLPETLALLAAIEAGDTEALAPKSEKVVEVRRLRNRPVHFTPFVGRRKELSQLKEYLRSPDIRLVTILGPGGSGKSRLASESATAQSHDFRDGAFFVALSDVHSRRGLVDQLAAATELQFASREGDEARERRLANHLAGLQALFVLDNFEQLLGAAPLLRQWLGQAPEVKFLVTSREPLDLQVEWLLPLLGLDQIPEGESYELFVLLARQQLPDFTPTTEDKLAIGRICQLLDGLPLGLELAAAWLRSMSLPEIAAAIQENLGFLQAQSRDVDARHRSLRAVFEQSWHNLALEEQDQFLRLAAFRDGFGREAAAAVAGTNVMFLTRLHLKSLLKQDGRRYRLHPLVFQFAWEKLMAKPALSQDCLGRHAGYFLGLLAEQNEKLKGGTGEAAEALGTINAEFENIRLAWQTAAERHMAEALEPAIAALLRYLILASRAAAGADILLQAIETVHSWPTTASKGKLLTRLHVGAARVLGRLGEHELIEQHAQEAIRLGTEVADIGYAYLFWGLSLQDLGQYERANEIMLLGLVAAEASGSRSLLADTYRGLGIGYSYQGKVRKSQQYWELALEYGDIEASPRGYGATLGNLGLAYADTGDYDRARLNFQKAADIFTQIHDLSSQARTLTMAGQNEAMQGNFEEAQRQYVAARSYLQATNATPYLLDALYGLLAVAVETGQFTESQVLLAELKGYETARSGQEATWLRLRGRRFQLLGGYRVALADFAASEPLADERNVPLIRFWWTLASWQLSEVAGLGERLRAEIAQLKVSELALEIALNQWLLARVNLAGGSAAAALGQFEEVADWAADRGVDYLWLQAQSGLAMAGEQTGTAAYGAAWLMGLTAEVMAMEPAGLPDPFLYYHDLLQPLQRCDREAATALQATGRRQMLKWQEQINEPQWRGRFGRADNKRRLLFKPKL